MFDRILDCTIPPAATALPVVVSVPHAGQDYPPALETQWMVPLADVRTLEDEGAGTMVAKTAMAGATVLQACFPRACLDVNRAADEWDSLLGDAMPGKDTLRTRQGYGVIPRRTASGSLLYANPLPAEEVQQRIQQLWHPWHHALGQQRQRLHARYGSVLLLDCHTMPPLENVDIVVGDYHGQSAAPWLRDALLERTGMAGFRTTCNTPYAGGFITQHYGQPEYGFHAIQLEVCRTLPQTPEHCLRLQQLLADIVLMLGSQLIREASSASQAAE